MVFTGYIRLMNIQYHEKVMFFQKGSWKLRKSNVFSKIFPSIIYNNKININCVCLSAENRLLAGVWTWKNYKYKCNEKVIFFSCSRHPCRLNSRNLAAANSRKFFGKYFAVFQNVNIKYQRPRTSLFIGKFSNSQELPFAELISTVCLVDPSLVCCQFYCQLIHYQLTALQVGYTATGSIPVFF